MFVTVNTKQMSSAKSVCMYDLHTKFHMTSSIVSLISANKPEAKYIFRLAVILKKILH
jgi:hypothetical protein